jgi:hypothetical protein
MKMTERIKEEVARIFQRVEYGRITFHLSPEKKTLDYTVEETHRIPLAEQDSKKQDWGRSTPSEMPQIEMLPKAPAASFRKCYQD